MFLPSSEVLGVYHSSTPGTAVAPGWAEAAAYIALLVLSAWARRIFKRGEWPLEARDLDSTRIRAHTMNVEWHSIWH